jgi:hypothetical protein
MKETLTLPKNFIRLELIHYINTLIVCISIHNIHLKIPVGFFYVGGIRTQVPYNLGKIALISPEV